jgi:NAD(P)-dependent dehydrogenase (short-subunit alcohol dehydrogenase family)
MPYYQRRVGEDWLMDLGLSGKVAVVTGGTKGIGMAVAKGLAAEGVHIALCSRNEAEAAETAQGITHEFDVRALGMPVDVTSAQDIDRFVHSVERSFGGTDILISNAGMGSEETILEAPDERWQYFWDLQVMAAVRLARGFVPLMRKRGSGVIINNASICARQPLWHEPVYNTVKAALVMFSKCLAHEVIGDNIRVNCVNPGLILTPAWRRGAESLSKKEGLSVEEYFDRIAREYAPIGRFATPEELAHFFVFLCSERASYCVGSSYYVDGGWLNVTT